jgi:hypothetical protein
MMKELPALDQLDRETAGRIYEALAKADYQIRRAKRDLRTQVYAAITDHRQKIVHTIKPEITGTRKPGVDYDKLFAILQKQPLTYDIIKNETGLNNSGVAEVITTLSVNYALWSPARGIYELLR